LQLLFLKPPDFLVLAFGNGGQRENFPPVDLMLFTDFSCPAIGRQLEHSVVLPSCVA
jgi:hypothetical protein